MAGIVIRMRKKKERKYTIISIITIVCIMLLWYVATENEWVNTSLIPKPQKVWKAFLETGKGYKGYTLWQHIGISLKRMFVATMTACIIAVPLGLVCGFNATISAIFEPIIGFYKPLPPLAYYSLLILLLGIGEGSKVMLLFLAAFAPCYISCVAAVSRVNKNYFRAAYSMGANRWQVFWFVMLPACLPDVFVGMRTAFGVAYTTLVAAEMAAANSGIGWMVLDAKNWFRNDIIFLGIIIMAFMGIAIDFILKLIEKKLIPWRGEA